MGCVPTKRRAIRQPIRAMSVRNSAVRNSSVDAVPTKISREEVPVIQSVPTTVTVPMVVQQSNSIEQPLNNVPPIYNQQTPTMAMLPPVSGPLYQPPPPPTLAQVMRPNSPLPMENQQFGRPQSMHPQIMYPQSQQKMLPPRPTSPYGPPMSMGSQRNFIPNIPTMQPIFHQPPPLVHQMSPNSLSSTGSPRSLKFDQNSQRSLAPNFGNPGYMTAQNSIPSMVPPVTQMSQMPPINQMPPSTQVSHMPNASHMPNTYSPMNQLQSASSLPPPMNMPPPNIPSNIPPPNFPPAMNIPTTNMSLGPNERMNSPPRSVLPPQNVNSRFIIEQPPAIPVLSNNISHYQNNAEILIELNRESADVNDENFQEIKIEKMDFGTTKAY